MTLQQLINTMQTVAAKRPAVKTIVQNDVFRLNSLPGVRYGVFAWTQATHGGDTESPLQTFSFTLFYVDRLRTDERNRVEIQSVGCELLADVLRTLARDYDIEIGEYTIQTFSQRFLDACAGAFAQVRMQVPVESLCDAVKDLTTVGDVPIL